LGWIEGRTVAIEDRWAEGRTERFSEIAVEFVRLDVIVTSGGALLAVKQATSVVPIVFALATDPIGSGFVASLARPGGNVTGLCVAMTGPTRRRQIDNTKIRGHPTSMGNRIRWRAWIGRERPFPR
jgi:putative ABC transport system substrate-binding protein